MSIKKFFEVAQVIAWGALIFLIPFGLPYVRTEPYAVSYLSLYCLVFIGLTILNLALGNLKLTFVKPRSLALVLIGLLLALAWGLFNTSPLSNGLGLWVNRLLLPLAIGYITYLMIRGGTVTLQFIGHTLYWSMMALVVTGSLQYFGVVSYEETNRLTGPYLTANTFARYLEVLLLMTLPWIIAAKRYWHLLGWVVGVLVLVGTRSYNGTATFYLGLLVVIALCSPAYLKLSVKRVMLALLIAGAVIVGLNASKLPKFQTSITDSRLSRLEYWHIAVGAIKDHPWTGIGIKTWELSYPDLVIKYGTLPPRNWSSSQPHNVFLDALLKAGIPGLLAVVAVLFWPIIASWRLLRRGVDQAHQPLALGVLASSVSLLLFGIIDDPIWHDDIMPLVMVLNFLLASLIVWNTWRGEDVVAS